MNKEDSEREIQRRIREKERGEQVEEEEEEEIWEERSRNPGREVEEIPEH